jgi:phosphoenolpyruvate carboxylase
MRTEETPTSIPAELDKALRVDVRVLGDLLGEVLRTQAGSEVYDTVERVRELGKALGRELGEPDGHYEETNAAGWDMVEDLWEAAKRMLQN